VELSSVNCLTQSATKLFFTTFKPPYTHNSSYYLIIVAKDDLQKTIVVDAKDKLFVLGFGKCCL